jgi:hypothetical protein
MIITHDTTIEEYEAWLATNPDLNSFKAAVRSTFNMIYRTLSRIGRLIKRIRKSRACTSGKRIKETFYPLCYDKNSGFTIEKFSKWLRAIKYELSMTTLYLDALQLADLVDDEIEMEGLKIEALEILKQNI